MSEGQGRLPPAEACPTPAVEEDADAVRIEAPDGPELPARRPRLAEGAQLHAVADRELMRLDGGNLYRATASGVILEVATVTALDGNAVA